MGFYISGFFTCNTWYINDVFFVLQQFTFSLFFGMIHRERRNEKS